MDRFKFCNFRKYKSKFKLKIFTNKLHFLPQNAGGSQTKSLCTEGKLGGEGREGTPLEILYYVFASLQNFASLPLLTTKGRPQCLLTCWEVYSGNLGLQRGSWGDSRAGAALVGSIDSKIFHLLSSPWCSALLEESTAEGRPWPDDAVTDHILF